MHAAIQLKPGKEKSLLRRHPWVFSGAIARLQGQPAAGDTLAVTSAKGEFLGWGAYSPHSQIRVRIWAWEQSTHIDPDFFYQRLQKALEARRGIPGLESTDSIRLLHAESDGLPGLIVDRYADTLVLQCLSSGAEAWLGTIADQLFVRVDRLPGFVRALRRGRAPAGGPARAGWSFAWFGTPRAHPHP
ncbi:MAG: hypothetical protein P8Z00_13145 [Anaerolineales bacterium]